MKVLTMLLIGGDKKCLKKVNEMKKVTILGSGMAGMGAAYRLRQENIASVVYEKNAHAGGHTSSWKNDQGYIFDEGPHISFTKDDRIKELFAESADQDITNQVAYMNNYWQGHWIKHPAQCNLYGLPENLVVDCLHDFIEAIQTEPGEITNYAEWLLATYGKTFSETFPMEYGLRYHTLPAEKMSVDWLGPRLYRPDLKEVLHGAVSPNTDDVHYITDYRYPNHDGFVKFMSMFLRDSEIQTNHKVTHIDPKIKQITFANGKSESYDALISSVPLPELIPMIEGVPDDVVSAADQLACSTCVVVNIGLDRDDISDAVVSYFYDRDFIFTRLSFPHLQSENNVPPGKGSIQAELYYSRKYRPLDKSPQDLIEPTIKDLKRCGLLKEDEKIISSEARLIPYANIIFDHDRAEAVNIVRGYLRDIGIDTCGRYGEWGYIWTDESFKSGERAADDAMAALK